MSIPVGKDRRQAQARVLGGLVQQTVQSNLPADQRVVPAWRKKQEDEKAKKDAEAAAAAAAQQQQQKEQDEKDAANATAAAGGDVEKSAAGGDAGKDKQGGGTVAGFPQLEEQYRSPFPADYYTFRELEMLMKGHQKDQKKMMMAEVRARRTDQPLGVAVPRSSGKFYEFEEKWAEERGGPTKIQVRPLLRLGQKANGGAEKEGSQEQ